MKPIRDCKGDNKSAANEEFAFGKTSAIRASDLNRIDMVCSRFELAWRNGTAPSLESCLDGFEGALRSALLTELLLLDIDYRLRDGQTPDPADYETRFPGETPVIESAFRINSDSNRADRSDEAVDRVSTETQLVLTSRIQLREFHAQGGLGVVYVADDENFGRRVAVKIPRKRNPGSTAQARLAREAEITGRLGHPGIVPVYSRGSIEDGRPCFVMPFIDGQTLQEAISNFHKSRNSRNSSNNPFASLDFRQLLQHFVAVCQAVSYAHGQQVIHRDIKPHNIMLGRFGETFLLDWGLAKSLIPTESETNDTGDVSAITGGARGELATDETAVGQQLGTPAFASPEQVTGDIARHDARSDIYALGATLYCMLVGKGPISLDDLTSAQSLSAHQRIANPRRLVETIPRTLEAICRKAMAIEQSDRYQTVPALISDLERYLADEPVAVMREPWIQRAGRWLRKHPRLVTGLAATVLVTALGFGVGSLLLETKNRQLVKSNQELLDSQQAEQRSQAETMKALHALTDGVIERWLAGKDELSIEDQLFVDSILASYQSFADSQPTGDDAILAKAEGYFRVGQLYRFLDNKQDAIRIWEAGLDVVMQSDHDRSDALRHLKSKLQSSLGLLLSDQGDRARGISLISEAIENDVKLLQTNSGLFEYQEASALHLFQLANEYLRVNELTAAEEHYCRSLKLTTALTGATEIETLKLNKLKAGIHHALGSSLGKRREFDEARKNLEISVKLHRKLAGQTARIQYRLDLGRTLGSLGRVNRNIGEHRQAVANLNEAIVVLEELSKTYPSLSEPLFVIASAHQGLARYDIDSRDYESALVKCESAQSRVTAAIEKSPLVLRYRKSNGANCTTMGWLCGKLGRADDAADYYQQALSEAEYLFNTGNHFSERRELIALLVRIGNLHYQQNKYDKTQEIVGRALTLIEELGDHPTRRQCIAEEVSCHKELGSGFLACGQFDESAKHWQSIIDLTATQPIMYKGENIYYSAQSYLALCNAVANPVQSLKVVDGLAARSDLVPPQIYTLARAAAAASQILDDVSEKKQAENRALELLELSATGGHFRNSKQLEGMLTNPMFDTLLEHEEFIRIEKWIRSRLNKKKRN